MPPDVAGSARGCLPADQSCFALSAGSSPYSFSSRQDSAAARACCTATSYLVVLGISFASLVILLVLCAIRWYLVRRSEAAEAAAAAAAPTTGGAGSSSPSSSSFSTATCNPAAALVGQFGAEEDQAADLSSYMNQYAYNEYMMDFAAGYFGGVVYDQFN